MSYVLRGAASIGRTVDPSRRWAPVDDRAGSPFTCRASPVGRRTGGLAPRQLAV